MAQANTAAMMALPLRPAHGISPANFNSHPQPTMAPNADEFDLQQAITLPGGSHIPKAFIPQQKPMLASTRGSAPLLSITMPSSASRRRLRPRRSELRTVSLPLFAILTETPTTRPPPLPSSEAEKWKRLESALRDIHEKNASGLSFEQLYRYAYKIVLKKAGDRLCENVKQFEERWFTDKVCPRIFKLISRNLVAMTLNDVPGSPRE
ncbi:hypothetical protein PG991_011136 [Apiospora marii]|uniref:Cullin N-terminal domain-containing protein n=1 Tax=Apiospora marii TaxID=335849 RepID=A0ABR1RDN3_9PEZI